MADIEARMGSKLPDDASFDLDIEDPEQPQDPFTYKFREHSTNPVIAFLQRVIEGPEVARDEPPVIKNSLLKGWDQWPALLRMRFPHRIRMVLLIGYLSLWYFLIHAIMTPSLSHGPRAKDSDLEVITLSCSGDGYFWKGKNAACGLGGEKCIDQEQKDVIIKCPALCDRGWTWAATPVGDDMVKYRQYSIGGGALDSKADDGTLTHPYRADSFPCASAVHAGVVSPYSGGCVRMSFDGQKFSFASKEGYYGTGWSVSFPSFFPSSFVFKELPTGVSGCFDPRFVVLTLNVILGAPVAYLCSGLVSYWVLTIVGFWTITITLDPPMTVDPDEAASAAQLISTGFARLLPLCFVLFTLWEVAVKRTQEDGSPLLRTLLWYPLFWIGTANVITFDRLPLDRFTPADIAQQKGALVTALFVVTLITSCVVVQGIQIWRSGRLLKYVFFYVTLIACCTILAMMNNLELRIHHYILGMILLPGTATRGATAYAIQGVLLGLLLSGVARWDFASIVETHVSLLRGEAGASAPPPTDFVFERSILKWNMAWPEGEYVDERLDGVSIMVNDIEYFVEKSEHKNINQFVFQEDIQDMLFGAKAELHGVVPMYIRMARASTTDESLRGDYSRAALLTWPGGNFTAPEGGRS